jgi:ribosome-associated translation inhibitor RaiA
VNGENGRLEQTQATAEIAGASRSMAYQRRRTDAEFRQSWDDAIEAAVDELEEELRRRALHGVEQPVFYGGKECGRVRTYNDALGMFLLRNRLSLRGGKAAAKGAAAEAEAMDKDAAFHLLESRLRRLKAKQQDQQKPPAGGSE